MLGPSTSNYETNEDQYCVGLSKKESSKPVATIMQRVLEKRNAVVQSTQESDTNCTKELSNGQDSESQVERKMDMTLPIFIPKENRLTCSIDKCSFRAKMTADLEEHFNNKHSNILSTYECPHCPLEITTEILKFNRIKNHLSMHGQVLHECETCNYYHYSRTDVLRHIRQCHAINFTVMTVYSRSPLNVKKKIETLYNTHLKSDNDQMKCINCDDVFKNCEQVFTHMKLKHELNVQFKCDYCSYLHHLLSETKNHTKTIHSNMEKRIRCVFLGKTSISKKSLSNFELLIDYEPPLTALEYTDTEPQPKRIRKSDSPVSSDVELVEEDEVNETREEEKDNSDDDVVILDVTKDEQKEVENDIKNPRLWVVPLKMMMAEQSQHKSPIPPRKSPNSELILEIDVPVDKSVSPSETTTSHYLTELAARYPQLLPTELGGIYLICCHCGAKTCKPDELIKHSSKHIALPLQFSIAVKLLCSYCYFIGSFKELKSHHIAAHANLPFITREAENSKKCGQCPYQFQADIRELHEHSIISHPDLYLQGHPTNTFITDTLLDKLRTFGSNTHLYKCFKCQCYCPTSTLCSRHIALTHKNDGTSIAAQITSVFYGCSTCTVFFDSERYAIRHIRRHLLPYGCNYCELQFSNHEQLRVHYEMLHNAKDFTYRLLNISMNMDFFLKMIIIFPNGLILTKREVEHTRYGHFDEFTQVIEMMEKDELRTWIARSKRDAIANVKDELTEADKMFPPIL